MRTYDILPSLLKALKKLSKKNKPLYVQAMKKIEALQKTNFEMVDGLNAIMWPR